MNATETTLTKEEMAIIVSLGYGAVTLNGKVVDRGLKGNVEMGILTHGDHAGVMKSIQSVFLANGWEYKVSPLNANELVNSDDHTIFVKDGFQIGFYAMDARVSGVESAKHYFTVNKSTWA